MHDSESNHLLIIHCIVVLERYFVVQIPLNGNHVLQRTNVRLRLQYWSQGNVL